MSAPAEECEHCGLLPGEGVEPNGLQSSCWSCGLAEPGADASPTAPAVDGGKAKRTVSTKRASDISPEQTLWLMDGLIPLGSIAVLAGVQGLGKSTLALEIAARVTQGALEGDLLGQARDVLYASAEDHEAATLVPRLKAAGADLSRVHFPRVSKSGLPAPIELPRDTEDLVLAAESDDEPVLLIIDPLAAFFGGAGQLDSHRDTNVRAALAPISDIAERLGLAVLLIMHLNKSTGTSDALLRVMGSAAFTAAPRSVLILGSHPDDPEGRGRERVLAHAKSNLAPLGASRACTVEPVVLEEGGETFPTSRIRLGEVSPYSASDVIGAAQDDDADERTSRDEAREFLRAELADGPKPAGDLLARAEKELNISKKTLRRAKADLGVVSQQHQEGGKHWEWTLPDEPEVAA